MRSAGKGGWIYHFIEDVAGQEVILNVGHLHSYRNAIVIGPLL